MIAKVNIKVFAYSFCLIYFLSFVCNGQQEINVTETTKKFIGTTKTINGTQIDVFLGIPYAQPPIGALRFKKPQPFKYDGPVNATKWGNPCFQEVTPNTTYYNLFYNHNLSEDCLYLNVWTPLNKTTLKPVMFWIHGGALVAQSASYAVYEGDLLAAMGDVVVVTINYRLYAFGFLYTGTDDAPGNVGFWDQALALQWVWDNIEQFGGDRNQITIFGESAGSWSVSLHLLSPITRHLFKNAIMMSGGALTRLTGSHPDLVRNNSLKVSKYAGCGDGLSFNQTVINCLRTIPANVLYAAADNDGMATDATRYYSQVLYGDEFLPAKPIQMLTSGDYKKNARVLIGTVDDEGSWLLAEYRDPVKYSQTNPYNFTKSEMRDEIIRYTSNLTSDLPINGEDVAKFYLSRVPANDSDLIRRSIGVAFGDFFLTCPTIQFAKLLYLGDRDHSKVYQYYFTAKLGGFVEQECSKWQGACHGTDLYPFLGFLLKNPQTFTNEEIALAKNIMQTITYFAKHGVPLPQEGIDWPEYFTVNNNVIQHYYEFSTIRKPHGNFGTAIKADECEKLWKPYVDKQ